MYGMVVLPLPEKNFRGTRMILRIRIPPTDLLEAIDDIMYAIKHTRDTSIHTFLLLRLQTFPTLLHEAYNRKQFLLHKAVKYNNLHAIRTFLGSSWGGSWINLPDRHGNTPILLALANKRMDIVSELITHGATIAQFSIMKRILQLKWEDMNKN